MSKGPQLFCDASVNVVAAIIHDSDDDDVCSQRRHIVAYFERTDLYGLYASDSRKHDASSGDLHNAFPFTLRPFNLAAYSAALDRLISDMTYSVAGSPARPMCPSSVMHSLMASRNSIIVVARSQRRCQQLLKPELWSAAFLA